MMQRTRVSLACVLLVSLAACGEHPGGDCPNCLLSPQELAQAHELQGHDAASPNRLVPAARAMCVGTPAPCGHYANAPQQCAAVRGCQATFATCEPKACRAFTDAATCTANRCSWHFQCGGAAVACFQASREHCVHQAGCLWLEDVQVCSGVARTCPSFRDPISCNAQTGCGVLRGCGESLVAATCLHNTTAARCAVNNACIWNPDQACEGTPASCGANATQEGCEQVSGCAWAVMQSE